MHNPAASPAPAPPQGAPSPRRPDPGTLLTLINGLLAGIGGTYATAHSVTITAIAGIMATTLALMVSIFHR